MWQVFHFHRFKAGQVSHAHPVKRVRQCRCGLTQGYNPLQGEWVRLFGPLPKKLRELTRH